jgi:hypothetical protein
VQLPSPSPHRVILSEAKDLALFFLTSSFFLLNVILVLLDVILSEAKDLARRTTSAIR